MKRYNQRTKTDKELNPVGVMVIRREGEWVRYDDHVAECKKDFDRIMELKAEITKMANSHVAELAKQNEIIAVAKEVLEFYRDLEDINKYRAKQAREALAKIGEMKK